MVRIDVLPDLAGHWSVTRDRVVDAEFDELDCAVEYARACVDRARRAGLEVALEIHKLLD